MTKDQLFKKLAQFLRQNVQLVADARDSNGPWHLLAYLQQFEDDEKERK